MRFLAETTGCEIIEGHKKTLVNRLFWVFLTIVPSIFVAGLLFCFWDIVVNADAENQKIRLVGLTIGILFFVGLEVYGRWLKDRHWTFFCDWCRIRLTSEIDPIDLQAIRHGYDLCLGADGTYLVRKKTESKSVH